MLKTVSRATPYSSISNERNIPTAFHKYLAVVAMERLHGGIDVFPSLVLSVGDIQRISDWICGRLEGMGGLYEHTHY